MEELISLRVPDSIQEFPLGTESIIFIVGGFQGAHAGYYIDNYNPYVYIFEPQTKMAKELALKFKKNSKVKVLPFGLGVETMVAQLSRVGTDRCSFIHRLPGKDGNETTFEGPYELSRTVEIEKFMEDEGIKKIDLFFSNCEGYEFKLLPWLVESGVIKNIRFLMVQFHLHHEGAEMMAKIREMIGRTHDVRDDYEPAWITWKPKPKVKKASAKKTTKKGG